MKLDVQVGDSIIYRTNHGTKVNLAKVSRLTKTQAVCEDGKRFMLDSGRLFGLSGYSATWGRKATQEGIEQVGLAIRIRKASSELDALKVTAKNLEAVEAFLGTNRGAA